MHAHYISPLVYPHPNPACMHIIYHHLCAHNPILRPCILYITTCVFTSQSCMHAYYISPPASVLTTQSYVHIYYISPLVYSHPNPTSKHIIYHHLCSHILILHACRLYITTCVLTFPILRACRLYITTCVLTSQSCMHADYISPLVYSHPNPACMQIIYHHLCTHIPHPTCMQIIYHHLCTHIPHPTCMQIIYHHLCSHIPTIFYMHAYYISPRVLISQSYVHAYYISPLLSPLVYSHPNPACMQIIYHHLCSHIPMLHASR